MTTSTLDEFDLDIRLVDPVDDRRLRGAAITDITCYSACGGRTCTIECTSRQGTC
jgi:hypothetical protein